MDKFEIKRVLHEQFVPMELATQQKLEYLQSDEVFTDNSYIPQTPIHSAEIGDDSLANAFMENGNTRAAPVYNQPPMDDYNRMQAAPEPQYISSQPTAQSINTSKQNLAAKIAALRGISMPGDYLRRK